MRAPPITRENAREMSARGNKARWDAYRLAKQIAEAPISANPTESEFIARTRLQLHKLDVLIDRALDRKDDEAFLKLAAAKEKLWKLVQPTAGVNRPSRQSRRSQAEAQPIETPQTPQDNMREIKHSSEIKPIRDMSQEM